MGSPLGRLNWRSWPRTPPEFRIPPRYNSANFPNVESSSIRPSTAIVSHLQCARYFHPFDLVVATTLQSIGHSIHSLNMKSLHLPTLFALAPLALAQQVLIPSTLPACAAQCTTLQNALSSCQTNPTTEFSCFCESSLLIPLNSNPPAQLQACTACSSGDLLTIGSWYQNYCKSGGSAAGAPQPSTTSSAAKAPSATSKTTSAASAAATGADQPDSSSGPQGPW